MFISFLLFCFFLQKKEAKADDRSFCGNIHPLSARVLNEKTTHKHILYSPG